MGEEVTSGASFRAHLSGQPIERQARATAPTAQLNLALPARQEVPHPGGLVGVLVNQARSQNAESVYLPLPQIGCNPPELKFHQL
jgi:hypothetical protein